MAIVVAEKIIEMFFIMLCGIVLFKTGLIDDKTAPRLKHSSYAGFTSYDIPILPDGL